MKSTETMVDVAGKRQAKQGPDLGSTGERGMSIAAVKGAEEGGGRNKGGRGGGGGVGGRKNGDREWRRREGERRKEREGGEERGKAEGRRRVMKRGGGRRKGKEAEDDVGIGGRKREQEQRRIRGGRGGV